MCRRITIPKRMEGRKKPCVSSVNKITISTDIDPGCTEAKERRAVNLGIVLLNCWKLRRRNLSFFNNIARIGGEKDQKIV